MDYPTSTGSNPRGGDLIGNFFFYELNKFHFYVLCEKIVGGSKTEISSETLKFLSLPMALLSHETVHG